MDTSLYRYAWRHTKWQQLWLLFVVVASMPFYFLSLDLPKRIINGPIMGEGFARLEATEPAFRIAFSLPDWVFGGGEVMLFGGWPLDRVGTLVYLCLLFLAFVLINGLFKLHISTYKGRLGERMLRRLRYELIDRVLRFPMPQFRRVRASEVATMVKDEVEPMGGFIGDAFVQPAFLLTQALTALVFILVQSVPLGLVAVVMVGVQVILIPRLRRRLLVLGRQRQLTARQLAGRVGEIIESIESVRTNDATNWERAEIASRLGRIFFIRFDIYQWKFLVKFLNNLLAQVTPFIFYLVGGYLAITGRLDIGQLVAVIAAYRELPAPLKELIDWDQIRADVEVKYAQLIEQFTVANLVDAKLQAPVRGPVPRIEREITASGVAIKDEGGGSLLEPTSIHLAAGSSAAVVGDVGAGGEYLAEAIAGLRPPASGRVCIDGTPIEMLPESFTGRRIAYVGPATYLPQSSLFHSLTYGLRHVPVRQAPKDEEEERRRRAEALASGNTEFDPNDDWIDYEAAGATGPEDLIARLREVLKLVDFETDVYRLGLKTRLPEMLSAEREASILEARADFRRRLAAARAERFVEGFDPGTYVRNGSVLENLVFGVPVPEALGDASLATHPYMAAVLAETGLDGKLTAMGAEIARTLIELFGDLEAGNPLLERMDLMAPDEMDEFRSILGRLPEDGAAPLWAEDRRALLKLAFGYVEPRHRLGQLDDETRSRIVAARAMFRDGLPAGLSAAIHFYEPGHLNRAANLQDNVLFGRVVDTLADAEKRSGEILRQTLEAAGLVDQVIELGLAHDIGVGGKRLSPAQAQKLVLARALLKRPDLLVVNRALSALDHPAQAAIIGRVLDRARAESTRHATLWVLSNRSLAGPFDWVLGFEAGRLVSTERNGPETSEEPVAQAAE